MQILVARGLIARLLGLAFRGSAPGALLLPRCRSVHTFGMRFALDLVWLDGAGHVVRIDRTVPPGRVRSCRRARSVLELKASPGTRSGAPRTRTRPPPPAPSSRAAPR